MVPRLCPGGTVAIIAGGTSVTTEQIEHVRERHGRGVDRVIVVNRSYRAAPWADVLYACDAAWWNREAGAPAFRGPYRFALEEGAARWPGVVVLRDCGVEGLEENPAGVRNGRNSGYQAINVAVHLGARRVVLLGFDLTNGPRGRRHHYEDRDAPGALPFEMFLRHFASIRAPLDALGIDVINCSPITVLQTFRRAALAATLP